MEKYSEYSSAKYFVVSSGRVRDLNEVFDVYKQKKTKKLIEVFKTRAAVSNLI